MSSRGGDIYAKQLEALKRLNEANNSFGDVQSDLQYKYNVSHLIGTGAYGSVWRATSLLPKILPNQSDSVAIKRIKNRQNVVYSLKRTLREIKILRHFKHDNIVYLYDVIMSNSQSSLYLVLDLMETDLHKIIQSPQVLSVDHVRWFLYQILRALKYLHSANVVHRDIKPSNLLVNSNCLLKLADFGMARCLNDLIDNETEDKTAFTTAPREDNQNVNEVNVTPGERQGSEVFSTANGAAKLQATIYVATRWYRSPELILCHEEYTTSIDMWSVGCIVAELFLRKPLFPGKSQVNQLNLIISLLGNPRDSYIDKIKSDQIKAYVTSLPKQVTRVQFKDRIPMCSSPEAMDFIQRMLIWEPNDRLPSGLALAHPFLKAHYRPAEEPICCRPYDYAFENSLASCEQLNSAIMHEIEKLAEVRRRLMRLMKKRESSQLVIQNDAANLSVKEENSVSPSCSTVSFTCSDKQEVGNDGSGGTVKKEQNLDVKAKLRAAILSDSWRSKGQRRTRTGRPKNSSKVTKKKIEETRNATFTPIGATCESKPVIATSPNPNAVVAKTSVKIANAPVITKQELISVANLKTTAAPFTVRIVTGGGGSKEHPNKTQIVTLSFVQPKAPTVIAKTGKIHVPKMPCAKSTVPANSLKAANTHLPKSISRANLIRSAQMPLKGTFEGNRFEEKFTLKPPFSIPKVTNNGQTKSSGFGKKAVEPCTYDFDSSSESPKDVFGENIVHEDNVTANAAAIGRISTIPIDHIAYPQSFKSKSPSLQEFESQASKQLQAENLVCKQTVHISKSVPIMEAKSAQTKEKNSFELYRNSPMITDLDSGKKMGYDQTIQLPKVDKMQAFLPSLYTNERTVVKTKTARVTQDFGTTGDTHMLSANNLMTSQNSSASTVPGNVIDEMTDLTNKMSSSSLRNDIHPFADFLEVPLSAVLTGLLIHSAVNLCPCEYFVIVKMEVFLYLEAVFTADRNLPV